MLTELEMEALEAPMARIKGQLVICDRCRKRLFLKYIGTEKTDGGYTTWDKFEKLPEGWNTHDETGLLCPNCDNEFNRLLEGFMLKCEKVIEEE